MTRRSRPAGTARAAMCLGGALGLFVPAPGQADPRPDTTMMRCADVAALVARSGAVVLASGPFIFGRVVRDGGFCTIEETVRPDFRPTRDAANCFVGYRCADFDGQNTGNR